MAGNEGNVIVLDTNSSMTKKEIAMERAGAGRKVAYQALAEACTATKITIDKYGEEHTEPDTANRLRAAELISRMNGDLKDKQEIEMSHKMEESDRELLMKYGIIKNIADKNIK